MPVLHRLPLCEHIFTPNQNMNTFQQHPTPLTLPTPHTPLLQQPYTPTHRAPPAGLQIYPTPYHPALTPMYSPHGYNSSTPPPFSPPRPRIVSSRSTRIACCSQLDQTQTLIPLTFYQQQSTCPSCQWEQSHAPLSVSPSLSLRHRKTTRFTLC